MKRVVESLHLDVTELDAGGGSLRIEEDRNSDKAGDSKCYRGEEAEDILYAHERGVHGCCFPLIERGSLTSGRVGSCSRKLRCLSPAYIREDWL